MSTGEGGDGDDGVGRRSFLSRWRKVPFMDQSGKENAKDEQKQNTSKISSPAPKTSRRDFLLLSIGALFTVPYSSVLDTARKGAPYYEHPVRDMIKRLREEETIDEEDEEDEEAAERSEGQQQEEQPQAAQQQAKPGDAVDAKDAEVVDGDDLVDKSKSVSASDYIQDFLENDINRAMGKRRGVDDPQFVLNRDWLKDDVENAKGFFRKLGVLAFIGGFSIFGSMFSDRTEGRIFLPYQYDVDLIENYFRLRPEKVAIRTMQIGFEALSLALGYTQDKIMYENRTRLDKLLHGAFEDRIKKLEMADRKLNFGLYALDSMQLGMINSFKKVFRANDPRVQMYWDWRWSRRASLNRQAITRLGPAFIKLGQALATRPDLVGTLTSRELQRLQDDMPFFPNEEAFEFIHAEIGAYPKSIFDSISSQPVAAASIGQVYKAVLDGVPVAVKIQRPAIVEMVALDFLIIRNFLGLLSTMFGLSTEFVDNLDEYASQLFEELNYESEAQNMEKFKSLYGSMEGIRVPEVFKQYSSEHVLVMEWIDGERLMDENTMVTMEDIPLIERGLRCCLTQMLDVGVLHGDPASNLIRTPNAELAFVDFGMVATIPSSNMYAMVSGILHLMNHNYTRLAEDLTTIARLQSQAYDMDYTKLAAELSSIFEPIMTSESGFTLIGLAEQLLNLSSRYPLILPSYVINNIRAMAVLEELAQSVDPSFRISNVIYPAVIRKVFFDPAPEMRSALEELVLENSVSVRWDVLELILMRASRVQEANRREQAAIDVIASANGNGLSHSGNGLASGNGTASEQWVLSVEDMMEGVISIPSPKKIPDGRKDEFDLEDSENQLPLPAAIEPTFEETKLWRKPISSKGTELEPSPSGASASAVMVADAPSAPATTLVTPVSAPVASPDRPLATFHDFPIDIMITFLSSPNGSILTKMFTRQLVDSIDFRLQSRLDNLEQLVLPPRLQPTLKFADSHQDIDTFQRMRENRRQARMLYRRIMQSGGNKTLRLLPLFTMVAVQVFIAVALRICARVIRDIWEITSKIARYYSWTRRRRIQRKFSTPKAQTSPFRTTPAERQTKDDMNRDGKP